MKSKSNLCWLFTAIASLVDATCLRASVLDRTFDPGTGAEGGIIETVLPQPDGKVLVSGDFTSFNGKPRGFIARLNADGTVDEEFQAHPGYWVRHMALQADGKIVIGGFFTNVEGIPRNRIARLNPDGTLDLTFDPGLGAQTKIVEGDDKDPFVFAVAVQADQKILVGGNFRTYNGVPSTGLVRLNPDGSRDTNFVVGAGANSWVRSLLPLTNGQTFVSGWFTSFNNQPFNRMVRLNADGSPDATFHSDFGDATAVYTMAEQTNNTIVIGGHFFRVNSTARTSLARLNPDGTADLSFDPGTGADGFVECARIQPDNKIVIGGYFDNVNGSVRRRIARINPDATVDPALSAEIDNFVWTVAFQNDGKILICGGFTTVDGVSRRGVARLLASDPDGEGGGGQNAAARLENPALDQGGFHVEVPTLDGKTYSLQFRDLTTSRWSTLPSTPGNGRVRQLLDPGASLTNSRIYRVQID